jgi:site-specific DNA-methyltransferase (adenine-specific)/modification methylase
LFWINTFGSGSFLVAALLEGRNFIGIEKNENVSLFRKADINYIQVAKKRLKTAWGSMDNSLKSELCSCNLIKDFENS